MTIIRSITTPGGLVAPPDSPARTNRRSKQSNRTAEWRAFVAAYGDTRDGMFIRDGWPRSEEPARRASHPDRRIGDMLGRRSADWIAADMRARPCPVR